MKSCVFVVDDFVGNGIKSRKVFFLGFDGVCGDGRAGTSFFSAGVLGRETGTSSGSGRDCRLSWTAFGGVVVAVGGAEDGAGAGVGTESFLDRVLLLLLVLDDEEEPDDLVADGDDVLADFLLGGPELWLAVCLRASRLV